MQHTLDIAADNLSLWRESTAQSRELCTLQAQQLGAKAAAKGTIEEAARLFFRDVADATAATRAERVEEQLAFVKGVLFADTHTSKLALLQEEPALPPPPAAPRVVFLDSQFGREALKQFEAVLPHLRPVTAPGFTAVCEELAGDRAEFALLPLEDSREGAFLHLYEEIDRFELKITHTCRVFYTGEGRSVLMALLSRRYSPVLQPRAKRMLACTVLEESSHALSDLFLAARSTGLTARRVDTLPASYADDIVIYRALFASSSEQDEQLFSLYLSLFQPCARITERYLHLKESSYE